MKENLVKKYVFAWSIAIFLAFLLISNQQQSPLLVQAQSCHLRELDLCAATLVVFMQSSSGLAVNEQDLTKQCGYLREADTCMKNYTRRCTTPLQRQMVGFMGEGPMDLLEEYCKPGSEIRKSYLKHATCLNGSQKTQQKTCIKDLQVAFEQLTSDAENLTKRLPLGCCAFRRFENCIGNQVEKRCGKEALNLINLVLKRVFSRMPEMLCKNYKPEGAECKAILPESGSQSKGSKSTSVLLRLLSAYTGV